MTKLFKVDLEIYIGIAFLGIRVCDQITSRLLLVNPLNTRADQTTAISIIRPTAFAAIKLFYQPKNLQLVYNTHTQNM